MFGEREYERQQRDGNGHLVFRRALLRTIGCIWYVFGRAPYRRDLDCDYVATSLTAVIYPDDPLLHDIITLPCYPQAASDHLAARKGEPRAGNSGSASSAQRLPCVPLARLMSQAGLPRANLLVLHPPRSHYRLFARKVTSMISCPTTRTEIGIH